MSLPCAYCSKRYTKGHTCYGIERVREVKAEVERLTAALVTLRSMKSHLPYEANATVEAALTEEADDDDDERS